MMIFPALPGLGINVKRSVLTSTAVQAATSGKELRVSWWSSPRYQYDLTFNFLRVGTFSAQTLFDEVNTLANFFLSQGGQFSTFLFTDPIDNAVSGMGFGVGNGSTVAFQLQRCPVGQYQDALGTWPVYTTPRTNTLLQSQALATSPWTTSFGGLGIAPSMVNNYGVAPDGSVTATRIQASRTSGNTSADYSVVTQPSGSTGNGTQPYTFSLWLRSNTGATQTVYLGTNGAGSLVTVTTSWQRFSWTVIPTAGLLVQPQIGSYGLYPSGTAAVDVLGWGAQVELGTTPTDYIPTVASAVTVTPSYWPLTGGGFEPIYYPAPGLQVFRQDWQGNQLLYPTARTNQLKYSQLQSNAAYTPTNVTVTGSISDPAGGTNAFTLTATAGGGNIYQNVTVSNVMFCDSLWARRRTGTGTVSLLQPNGSSLALALTSAWQQFSGATLPMSGTTAQWGIIFATSGDAIDVAFAQQELGSTPTAYIPTTTAAVTVTDYTLTSGGTITFANAPVSGAVLTWSGSFWRQCRFAQDSLDWEQIVNLVWKGGSIKVLSVK